MKAAVRLAVVLAWVLFLDQASKALVLRGMRPGQSVPVVEGFFNLTLVLNPGAAFGLFRSAPESFRVPFFLGISAAAVVVILVFYFRAAAGNPILQVGLALVLGGAAGNLVDRLRFRSVVDFLDVYYGPYHWPAFNVADTAISLGVGLLLLDMLLERRRARGRRK